MARPQASPIVASQPLRLLPTLGDAALLERALAAVGSWAHLALGLELTAELLPDGWRLRIHTLPEWARPRESNDEPDFDVYDDEPDEDWDDNHGDWPEVPEGWAEEWEAERLAREALAPPLAFERPPPPLPPSGRWEQTITLRLTPAIELALTGEGPYELLPSEPASHTLTRGAPFWRGWWDAAAAPYARIYRHVWQSVPDDDCTRAGHQRALTALFRRLNDHLVSRGDPVARKAALRFPQRSRRWVYSAIRLDPTGRVLQATRHAPGLVAFAAEAASHRLEAVAECVWRGLAEGRRIRALSLEALHELGLARTRALQQELLARDGGAARLDRFTRARQRRLRWHAENDELHAVLLRRARANTPRGLLLGPIPAGVRAEDLPTDRRGQRDLGRALMRLSRFEHEPWMDDAGLEQLIGYLVKNPQSVTLDVRLERWLRAGNTVSRRTDGVALRRRLRALPPPDEPGPPVPPPEAIAANVPFPPPLLPGFRSGGDWLEPLLDRAALATEGAIMRHCVGTYWQTAVEGAASYYCGVVLGSRVTLELALRDGRPVPLQVKLIGNGRPPRRVVEVIAAWAETGLWVGA